MLYIFNYNKEKVCLEDVGRVFTKYSAIKNKKR